MNVKRWLASATLGLLGAATASSFITMPRRADHFAFLMCWAVLLAGPAALLTCTVLRQRVRLLRRRPAPWRLAGGVAVAAVELLSLLGLPSLLFGVVAIAVGPSSGPQGVACGIGLALGCLIGAGRCRESARAPIHQDRTGPPFFREPRVPA
jgi:hypothetical protein